MEFEPEAFSEDFQDFTDGIAEDAVCGNGYNDENRYEGDDCPLDGDAETALASIGWGMDEDYAMSEDAGGEW